MQLALDWRESRNDHSLVLAVQLIADELGMEPDDYCAALSRDPAALADRLEQKQPESEG